jgi:predicted phosphodiesterase
VRVAAFADVHGNVDALEAVFRAAVDAGVDELWSLGDVLGPGPDGARAVALVRSYCRVALIGNHDRDPAALATFDGDDEDLAWLRARKPAARRAGVQCWHGSPRHPVHEYVTAANAGECLARQRAAVGLVGHTHEPAAWRARPDGAADRVPVAVDEPCDLSHAKWLLNPGAVVAGGWWLELDLDVFAATWRRAGVGSGRIGSGPWKATSSATGTRRGTGSSATSTRTRSARRS